jgi:NAD(P)-dependent dehydrogenase (short-subunit alcohol dehydrogenase family)
VTGGNGGTGRAMTLGLARAGVSVAVMARNEEKNHLVLAIEFASHNIQVNAIAPGWIGTDMTTAVSGDADSITGATLPLDGGYLIY